MSEFKEMQELVPETESTSESDDETEICDVCDKYFNGKNKDNCVTTICQSCQDEKAKRKCIVCKLDISDWDKVGAFFGSISFCHAHIPKCKYCNVVTDEEDVCPKCGEINYD